MAESARGDRSASVAIVGCGPVGLSAALLLGRFGVDAVAIERRATSSAHPKAHVLNARTMELFRTWGVEQRVRDHGLPTERGLGIGFVTRLAGDELGAIRFTDYPELMMEAIAQSPSLPCSCPQDLVEPSLREAVDEQGAVDMRFGVELEDLEQDADGVTIRARDAGGRLQTIQAAYAIAADGARSPCRERLGVPLERDETLGHQVNIYFEADLRRHVEERPYILFWVLNADTAGVFIALDGSSRWVYNCPYDPETQPVESFTPERCQEIVRLAAGVDDLDVRVHSVMSWRMETFFAESFRHGRVFLAGDAAHAFPPTGGFGLNTGVADAHNLCWKLASVLDGRAAPGLLDTYEPERLPVARFNAEQSTVNATRLTTAIAGVVAGEPDGFAALERADGAAARARMAAIVPEQREHFEFQGQAMGYSYESGAVVPDGTPAIAQSVARYSPSARPGSRAPHAWLLRDGEQVSTVDLFEGRVTVLAAAAGDAWRDAARELGLDAYSVGPEGSDLVEQQPGFAEAYGLEPAGAVLVRPDGHVAWRSAGAADDPGAELREALGAALGRRVRPAAAVAG